MLTQNVGEAQTKGKEFQWVNRAARNHLSVNQTERRVVQSCTIAARVSKAGFHKRSLPSFRVLFLVGNWK